MRIVTMTALVLALSTGGGNAQTGSPVTSPWVTGVPRVDARRAPALAPTQSGSTALAPKAPTITANGPASPDSKRAGKDPANAAITDCMQLWDMGTHMTKQEWATSCRRVQGRVDAKVDVPKAGLKRP
jgi:hypothetical protein